MARKDFIISFFAMTPLLQKSLGELQTPIVLFQPSVSGRKYKEFVQGLGNSVLSMWNKAKGQGDELGRVGVLSFSEGCQGLRAVLETTDASAIDAVVACDGIHTGRAGPLLEMSLLSRYIAFARLAAQAPPSKAPDTKLMIITHSAIGPASLPPTVASTTQTAAMIWGEVTRDLPTFEGVNCGFDCPAAVHVGDLSSIVWPNAGLPVGTKIGGGTITPSGWTTTRPSAAETGFIPSADFTWFGMNDGWTEKVAANNLYVFGWSYPTKNATKDPTGNRDHVFQANLVLPHVAAQMLVTRWNHGCGNVSGFGGPGPVCGPGGGTAYGDQQATPLDNPYPFPIPKPVPPPPSPTPKPPPVASPSHPAPGVTLADLAMFAGGVAAGYYGGKRLFRT